MNEKKRIRAEIKGASESGDFEAVIATLGVVDSDGDIVEPGAFEGVVAPIVPAHDQSSVPLGKVTRVEERGAEAVAIGKFNLSVSAAKDWHSALMFDLEQTPPVQEWSWGYHALRSRPEQFDGVEVRVLEKLDVLEFSPVLRGASVGTRTLYAKSKRHETETSDAVWDAVPHLRAFKGEPTEMFAAFRDELGLFPHHFTDDGKAGAASTRACIAAIVSLNRDQGLTPDERKAAHAHLAGHLEDAGVEPPELLNDPGVKLVDHLRLVTWEAEAVYDRLKRITCSEETRAAAIQMATAVEDMQAASLKMSAMVADLAPSDDVARALVEWAVSESKRSDI